MVRDLRFRTDYPDYCFREGQDCDLVRISDIHDLCIHPFPNRGKEERMHCVGYVAERPGLFSFSVNRYGRA